MKKNMSLLLTAWSLFLSPFIPKAFKWLKCAPFPNKEGFLHSGNRNMSFTW